MRFLCLHGGSTNAEIFEIQTGGLRQQLEAKGHSFKFINGKFDAEVEAELDGVVDGPFYNHYAREPELPRAQLAEAFEHTYQAIEREGPFDAVMGFSQGAALAAALIVHHAATNPGAPPLFRVAVFLCGVVPFESSGVAQIVPRPDFYPITIPTAHVVGKLDPWYTEGVKLYGLCEPGMATYYDHGSKHMVPFDMKNTEEIARAVEKTIAKAMGK